MQVRHTLAASLLAVAAVGAMAQEIDPAETLQARNLAARPVSTASSEGPTRACVLAEVRAAEASGQVKVGELADATPAVVAPKASWASRHATHPYARSWLHGDRKQARPMAVADVG